MHLYRFDKKKANKLIALSSAFVITISNSLSTVLAKGNTVPEENIVTGGVAEPYVPPNAKLDENNKPLLDEEGNFILLDEEGKIIPKDVLESYYIKPNLDGEIIHKIPDYSKLSLNARSTKKLVHVGSKNLNIRSATKTTASIIGKIPPNSAATILEDNGTWLKVKYKTITGWVSKEYANIVQESPASVVKNITPSNVRIRSSNSTSGTIIGNIPAGGTATAIDSKGGWIKVLYGDIVGWSSEEYMKYEYTPNSQKISVTSASVSDSIYVKDKTTNSIHKTSTSMKDANGRHMYCLDPERLAPNGHPYYKDNTLDDVAYRILKYGYPNVSFTGDASTDRIITQMALWGHVDPARLNINNIIAYRNSAQNADMLNHIQSLYNKAKSGSDTQTVSVKFSQTNLEAKSNGDGFVTDYISLIGSGDIKSANTTLKFFDTATGIQRTDIKILLENGQTTSSVALGQKFRLLIPKSSSKGNVKIQGSSNIVHTVASSYSTNLAGIQDAAVLEDISENKVVTNNVIVNWNGVGTFTINKLDANSKAKLEGAEFSVKDSTGTVIGQMITDANGTATSPELPFGTYKVQETKAPFGYELDPTVHTVELNSTTPVTINHTNKKIIGSIQITKVDAEDPKKVLSGAEFTLYDYKNNIVSKATTDINGIASFNNLTLGAYTIKETKAPNGYVLSDQVISTEIKTQGQSLKFTVINSKKVGEVEFSKTDVSTGDIIEGATIEIKGVEESNKHINISFVSSKEGNKFKLPVGKYEFKEIIAPEGYILSEEIGTFEIKENGEVVKANLKNTPISGSVKITKVDAENDTNKLEGAEFTLYDATGKELSKTVSDSNGIAKFEKLAYGEYSIKETKAPKGYILVDTPISFKISENNKTLTYTVTNSKKVGEVEFSKTDVSTGDIIEGATIEIKGVEESNKHINISFVSSKEGNKFKLPVGKYEFKEIIAPEGYILSEEIGTFEIKENGEVIKANLKNTPIIGSVEIIKIASEETTKDDSDEVIKDDSDKSDEVVKDDSKEASQTESDESSKASTKLKDAEFTLYDKDGKELSKVTTDENGFAKFENIPYGEYSIKETKSPEGYVLTNTPINFKITKHQEILTYTITNDRAIGEVDFTKTDVSTGDIIEGAIIEIKGIEEINKDIKFTFISSKEGNRFKLPTGKYEFKETVAPEGYILSEEVGTFEIKENGEIVKANLKNVPFTANLKILKVDNNNKSPLSGAEFTLTDKDGNKVHSGTTDKDGVLLFSNLKIGKYTLTETKAPNGYLLPEKSIEIEVTNQSNTIELEIENKSKLAQTGGDFTISGLIYTGLTLMTIAFVMSRKEFGGLE